MSKLFTAAIALTALTVPGFAAAQSNGADTSVTEQAPTAPPVAERRDHTFTTHGITLSDPYHWLKDQSYPVVDDEDVLDYVKAENAWFEAQMAPHEALVEELFEEMKGRIKEDDSTVPQKDGDWLLVRVRAGQRIPQALPQAGGGR